MSSNPEPFASESAVWLPTPESEPLSPLWSTTYVIRQEPRWVARMRKYVRR